jgi:hypothetical protein
VFLDKIPSDETLLYWVKGSDSGFGGFYSYATKKLCLSCVPFSIPCVCLNIFNAPCIHSEYTENTNRIILATEYSLIIGTLSSTGGIERVDICNWKRVKYLGTKAQYEKKKAGSVRNPLSCSDSSDILIYTQNADEKIFRGINLDYVPDRDNCVSELTRIKKLYVPKAVRERTSVSSSESIRRSSHSRSVSFSSDIIADPIVEN